MNRIEYLNKINSYAARFVLEVEGFNASSKYDINIHAESFLIPVLNEVFHLSLENLNSTQKKNYPAIDLADFKNRVAFQVTATSDYSKIESTIETFFAHELHRQFDIIYIYIITNKKEKYNEKKLNKLLPNDFIFTSTDHIIDKDDLLKRISEISSTLTLQNLARLYEHEFSEIQVEQRKKEYAGGYLNHEPENIFPNLLRVSFPDTFYKAELDIDEEKILSDINIFLTSTGKKAIKKMRQGKMVKHALRMLNFRVSDWILHENWIYTFRRLDDPKEPLNGIVDKGTITSLDSKDFSESNEDSKNVFKYLLRCTLTEFCKTRELEWYAVKEIFRFANNTIAPREKKIRWKGKNLSTKTVIFEMINKKEGHIICFRNLAFKSSFMNISNEWFLVLNPTWSFTNPGGYKMSRFESAYMSGLKRLENNNSVFNYFRFFKYYLSHSDLFTTDYPYFKINESMEFTFSPKIDERTWNPVKLPASKEESSTELKFDNELNDNSLFD